MPILLSCEFLGKWIITISKILVSSGFWLLVVVILLSLPPAPLRISVCLTITNAYL